MRQRTAGKARPKALGWLRRCRALPWLGLFALLVQVFVPPAHDAHDIAAAFARAGRLSDAPADTARVALALLEQHQHGVPASAGAHGHGAAQRGSPAGSDRQSDDKSGSLPCPVWQGAQAATNFVPSVLPALYVPALLPTDPPVDRAGSLGRGQSFSHPQSRAPPRAV